MNIATIPRSILRLQYQFARFPLQLIEDRVVGRWRPEAPARLAYERSLGVLDAIVGSALGDPGLKRHGASLAKRSDELSRAARLDAAAAQRVREAEADLETSRDEAITDVRAARTTRQNAVEHTRTVAEQRKRAATERAEQSASAAKKQVDDVAARRKESAREAEHQDLQRIQAAEKKVTAAANSKLDDAKAKREEAEGQRAQADRVEQLADAEKRQRQAKRST